MSKALYVTTPAKSKRVRVSKSGFELKTESVFNACNMPKADLEVASRLLIQFDGGISMKIIVSLMMMLVAFEAGAADMFYEDCGDQAAFHSADGMIILAGGSGFAGLSCKDLKSTIEATHVISMALMPVSVALSAPGAKEQIAGSLAAYGLTLANPAVLGVTVLGAVGVVTIYFVMKKSLDECEAQEREQLRQDLLRDLKNSFNTNGDPGLDFQAEGA